MDNQEVVNFVETFRCSCRKNIDFPTITDSAVTYETASIAQLLCEEARTRWFSIVEEENVMIDDISCIILEFNEKRTANSNIKCIPIKNQSSTHISDVRRATTIHEVDTRDPRRGSFCAPK